MASWKEQALIEAPVEEVWGLLEDPSRYAEWGRDIEVTGVPDRIEKGSTFEVTAPTPLGVRDTTTFKVEELDELREIKLRCQKSGYYSRWLLTEARGDTFANVEYGIEPFPGLTGRALSAIHTKGYLRRAAQANLDGLRRALRTRSKAARSADPR